MLMLLASSLDMPVEQRHIVTKLMIQGFSQCAGEAGTMVTGGHSILNPWPIIGGVAKSICKTSDFIECLASAPSPHHARCADPTAPWPETCCC